MSFTKGAARPLVLTACKALSGRPGATAEADTMPRPPAIRLSVRLRRLRGGAAGDVPAVAPVRA